MESPFSLPPKKFYNLAFLIPASPNEAFFSQIAMFRMALNQMGEMYQQASVIVTFGDEQIQPIPDRWQPYFKDIKIQHVPPDVFKTKKYMAQGDGRWEYLPSECDFAIFTDADVLLLKPIDDLLDQLAEHPAVAGSIAHLPLPTLNSPDDPRTPQQIWNELAEIFLGHPIDFDYLHTFLISPPLQPIAHCPFYVNFGFVIVPTIFWNPLRDSFLTIRPQVESILPFPYFSGQVAFTLALYSTLTPTYTSPIKYNFPNDPIAEVLYPEDYQDIRVIHYLRTQHFDRHTIFASENGFLAFLELQLTGSEKLFQDFVRQLTDARYPFNKPL